MALVQEIREAQPSLRIGSQGPEAFQVLRYRGTEGLCQLYRFEIELVHDGQEVELESFVGQPAALTIDMRFGQRCFHGVIGRFEMTGETHGEVHYRAELWPMLWLLNHRSGCRIFQNQTTRQIIAQVLRDGGIPEDQIRWNLTAEYEPREYCVQYRETDYNFICRLMEHEGLRWRFENDLAQATLVIEDGPESGYEPIPGTDDTLPYRPPSVMNVGAEHVSRFRLGASVRPGAVALQDFNFEKPRLDLDCSDNAGRDPSLQFHDYPGEYTEQKPGDVIARIRSEEFDSRRVVGHGRSNCPRLVPGRTFQLSEHPGGLNREYLLVSVTHQGKQPVRRTTRAHNGYAGLLGPDLTASVGAMSLNGDRSLRSLAEALLKVTSRVGYDDATANRPPTDWLYHGGRVNTDAAAIAAVLGRSPLDALTVPNLLDDRGAGSSLDQEATVYECSFECVRADAPYRPARVTPWPTVRGAQTARVVGPKDEEIHTDRYGRVKVQFHWDREGNFSETASCWIRVSQGMAGGQYGMMFLPRVGQEVVVDFLEGNPDKPLVVGRVFNAEHMPPYPLPESKTRSVIKTRSTRGGGGANEIRFEDLKDSEQLFLHAQKDLHVRARNDSVEAVEHDRHMVVGNDRIEQVEQNFHLKIAKGDRVEEIGRDQSLTVKGKVSTSVKGTHSTRVAGDVVEEYLANHRHEVTDTHTTKATNLKLEASAGLELKCGASSIVLTPSALFIVGGPVVNINSGNGPPVAPLSAKSTPPAAPRAPLEADRTDPGTDTRYDQDPKEATAALTDVPTETPAPSDPEEEPTSWIEIQLVDQKGRPVPGEPYEVRTADAKLRSGSLDANGFTRITGIVPGQCEICFPKRDGEIWQRV